MSWCSSEDLCSLWQKVWGSAIKIRCNGFWIFMAFSKFIWKANLGFSVLAKDGQTDGESSLQTSKPEDESLFSLRCTTNVLYVCFWRGLHLWRTLTYSGLLPAGSGPFCSGSFHVHAPETRTCGWANWLLEIARRYEWSYIPLYI